MPTWFLALHLLSATAAAAAWFLRPELGPWPLVVGLAPWAVRIWLRGRPVTWTLFTLPLALFMGTAGLSVWAAFDREAAWAKFWLLVGAVLVFYAMADWVRAGRQRDLAWLIGLLGVAATGFFLLSHDWDAYPAKVAMLAEIGRAIQSAIPLPVALPALHPNIFGGVLALTTPFAAGLTLERWNVQTFKRSNVPTFKRSTVLAALVLIANLMGLALTMSRGAWIAVGLAGGLAALWSLLGVVQPSVAERRLAWLGVVALLASAGMSVLLLVPGVFERVIAALPSLGSGLSRLQLYRGSEILAADYPFIGAGLGNFMMLYSSYALLIHVGFSTHAHNLYLDLGIEQGAPAVLALLLLAGLVAWRWWGAVGKRRGYWQGVAALALVAVLAHGLVDDALYASRAAVLLFVPFAFAVNAGLRHKKRRRSRDRWADAADVGAGLVPARPDAADFIPDLASARERSDRSFVYGQVTMRSVVIWLVIIAAIIAAVLVPWGRPLLARAYANLGAVAQSQAELSVYSWPEYVLQDAVRREVDLSRATAYYQRALEINPGDFTANRRLGQIELSLGYYPSALARLELAYAARPGDNTTRQLLAEALLVNGQTDVGSRLWATVDDSQKQRQVRAAWYQELGDTARVEALRAGMDRTRP